MQLSSIQRLKKIHRISPFLLLFINQCTISKKKKNCPNMKGNQYLTRFQFSGGLSVVLRSEERRRSQVFQSDVCSNWFPFQVAYLCDYGQSMHCTPNKSQHMCATPRALRGLRFKVKYTSSARLAIEGDLLISSSFFSLQVCSFVHTNDDEHAMSIFDVAR